MGPVGLGTLDRGVAVTQLALFSLYPGKRQCRCGVWMADDARPHCAVCELRRAPHLVIVAGRYQLAPGGP